MSNNHILIAEDNLVNQKVVSGMLKRLGYTTEIANNGQEAIDALRNGVYDAVLMDCQMPVMDGFSATRLIREMQDQGQLPFIPVIAVTANAMAGDKEKCLASGMDDFLPKPIQLNILAEVLATWIERAQAS